MKPPSTPSRDRRHGSPREPLLLAGDIGGTRTRIGLFKVRGAGLVPVDVEEFASREHRGLKEILDAFFSEGRGGIGTLGSRDGGRRSWALAGGGTGHSDARTGRRGQRARADGGGGTPSPGSRTGAGRLAPSAAAFGIAGPVIHGRSEITNLPWVVDRTRLARQLKIPVALVNDLEATAHAIPDLSPRAVSVLNQGRTARHGNLAIIAAGTGLGEAFVLRRNGEFIAGATEGGHSDFAPGNPEEIEILKFLADRFEHVSVERVLSGAGLVNVYRFLGGARPDLEPVPGLSAAEQRLRDRQSPVRKSSTLSSERPVRQDVDVAARISAAALDGSSPRAVEALRIFVSVYGAEAGNLALKVLATGGVYIGGGIAPRILPALRSGGFMRAFLDKGRFRPLLRTVPVKVILDDRAALFGAARIALSLASEDR